MNHQYRSLKPYARGLLQLVWLSLVFMSSSRAVITGETLFRPQKINQKASFTFEVDLSVDIQKGGSLQITFPSEIDLPPSASISCSAIYGFTGDSPTCTRVSSTTVKLTDVFPNKDRFLIFSVNNVVNPSYVSTFFT